MTEKTEDLFSFLCGLAVKAGDSIMEIYGRDFGWDLKSDESPVTAADRLAHGIISEGLRDFSVDGGPLPVLSEEGRDVPFGERRSWPRYWLVDPLDGTKEFISRNGEFTVNIALVDGEYPMLGLVYVPVGRILYYGGAGYGSFSCPAGEFFKSGLTAAARLPLNLRRNPDVLVAAGSRSHRSGAFDDWVAAEAEARGCSGVEVITAGSSLKFCLAAEGRVDVFPRFGPTMEWDTGAAQAVAEGAGLSCCDLNGKRLRYNKRSLLNDGFIVSSTGRG